MLERDRSAPAAAKAAWATLLGLAALEPLRILVDPASPLGPPGWIAVLALDDTITAAVPDPALEERVRAALSRLDPHAAVRAETMAEALPMACEVLGPAALFYPPAGWRPANDTPLEETPSSALAALIDAAPDDDVAESGIAHITSPASVVRSSDGAVIAACGHRRWPNGVAHLAIVVHPDHRRTGLGRQVAEAAIARATADGLLPQWRARPEASKALARRVGLAEVGAQLSLRPS